MVERRVPSGNPYFRLFVNGRNSYLFEEMNDLLLYLLLPFLSFSVKLL